MITHQGSRALNHIRSTHAPYSPRATNQVGPSTWKNFCLSNCMAWLQAPFYRLTGGLAKLTSQVTRARKRTPGAQWPPGGGLANTGLQYQNPTATHHKKPD